MKKLFQWSHENPYHISVGVVVVNDKGSVGAHFISAREATGKLALQDAFAGVSEVYSLLRESLENNETLEEAVTRGLQEEFGATGTIERYLGSIQSRFREDFIKDGKWVEKTTLYFQVKLSSQNDALRADEPEKETTIKWIAPQELISHMERQGVALERTDLDESKILKTYMQVNKL